MTIVRVIYAFPSMAFMLGIPNDYVSSLLGLCVFRYWEKKPSYEHVDSAAHAVFFVLVVHDGPVVQQPLQQTNNQSDKVLARLGQVLVFPAVLQ